MVQGPGNMILSRESQSPDDWEELLSRDEFADYFHTSHWAESACAAYSKMEATWLCLRQGERLVGGLCALLTPRPVARWQSGLEGTSGGALLDGKLDPETKRAGFEMLITAYLQLRDSQLGSTCLSLNQGHENQWAALLADGAESWPRQEIQAAAICLGEGLTSVEMNLMKKNKRNERNRALKRGAEVIATRDPGLLAEYYPIYEQACLTWQQTPAPLAFLQALLADPNRISADAFRTFFTCVTLEGKVIGGHLNLQYGDRVIAWNGVTDPKFARTHFPATLAVWGDLEESCRRGARWLDLGASGGVVSLDGFKKHFGAVSEIRGHYVLESAGVKILRGGKKLLQSLKPGSSGAGGKRWHDDLPDVGENS